MLQCAMPRFAVLRLIKWYFKRSTCTTRAMARQTTPRPRCRRIDLPSDHRSFWIHTANSRRRWKPKRNISFFFVLRLRHDKQIPKVRTQILFSSSYQLLFGQTSTMLQCYQYQGNCRACSNQSRRRHLQNSCISLTQVNCTKWNV